ncbi:MAG TPA: hypothetical protein VHH36_05590, partial [Candidatus Thermoplasmatota archaeon]|nr:hypothetical protein [Candidatus Thermoplasmatota archaeon]
GVIETLSQWSAPGEHAAEGLRYSMHNPRFMGSTLILAYYHGGVWALDLSTEASRASPVVVGQFTPSETNGWMPRAPASEPIADARCGKFNRADAPLAFDVEIGDGVVYVADVPTGLYAIEPTWP